MSDQTVASGGRITLSRVEGDLKVGRGAVIRAESGDNVVVGGDVVFDGGATVSCSLECNSIAVKAARNTGGTVQIQGDLSARGLVDVADSLEVAGSARADAFDVGGHLTAGSLNSKRIRVGGHLKVGGPLEAGDVQTGGHLSVLGTVKIADLHVGGHSEVGGGSITGHIVVRGHFTSKSALEFGEIQTYGNFILPAGSKGDKLSVLGRAEFRGDAYCRVIEVKGVARFAGNCEAVSVDVSGRMKVSGSLDVAKEFRVFGAAEVGEQLQCASALVAGMLKADGLVASGSAEVDGWVRTARGLKARSILVRRGSRVDGPLVGEVIEIGRSSGAWRFPLGGRLASSGRNTSVGDVYGGTVSFGSASRAKRVYAESLEMDDGSHADQVAYTKELKLRMNNVLSKPAVKASSLPEPPI